MVKFFRDPIHNYIEVDESLLNVVDHPLFQRLRRIKQLGLSHYVFHGAEHSRFGHVLGVMKVVEDIIRVINFGEEARRILIAAGLLHDIGHTPLSHTLEGVIKEVYGKDHEAYSELIILKSTLRDALERAGYNKKDIKNIAGAIRGRNPDPLLNQIIHSELDADRIDYLLRDSHYCGVKYGLFDYPRLLNSFRLYDRRLVVSEKGRYVVEEFLISRFYMYVQIYAHRTKRAFDIMARKILKVALESGEAYYPNKPDELDDLIYYDDSWFFWLVKEFARGRIKNGTIYSRLAKMLLNRERLKLVDENRAYIDPIRPRPADPLLYLDEEIIEELADMAKVNKDEIFVDGPEIDLTRAPYIYSPEEQELSILILTDDGELEDIAKESNSIIGQIARKRIVISRIYTLPENYRKVHNAWEKLKGKYGINKTSQNISV